jgi:hypothetical protein
MKIIDAYWEKRNIGVDTTEIFIEGHEVLPDILTEIKKHERDYNVIKIPIGRADIINALQEAGYVFIETLTQCYEDSKEIPLNSIQKRILQSCLIVEALAADLEGVFESINMGLFQTDRISLDPHFGIRVGNRRYCLWIQDEIARGAKLFIVNSGQKKIGFFILKKTDDKEYYLFLSGLFPEFQKSGIGFCPHCQGILKCFELGARRVKLSYSSNNRGAAALHMNLGHRLDLQYYVFIKHKSIKDAKSSL